MQWAGAHPQPVPSPIVQSITGIEGYEHPAGDILVAVNTDPHHVQDTMVHVPIHEMGIDDDQPYVVHDLLTGARYHWRGVRNYVRLDPADQPGHLLRVEHVATEATEATELDSDDS